MPGIIPPPSGGGSMKKSTIPSKSSKKWQNSHSGSSGPPQGTNPAVLAENRGKSNKGITRRKKIILFIEFIISKSFKE